MLSRTAKEGPVSAVIANKKEPSKPLSYQHHKHMHQSITSTRRGNGTIIALACVAVAILGIIVLGSIYVSYSNSEVRLRNAITAKQVDNKSELDNMQKKIGQTAQVTQEQARALQALVVGYASSRSQPDSGKFATLVREAVPNLDQSTYKQLMNIITGSRDAFTMRQKELLDLKREHDNIRTTFPGSLIVGGRPEIVVVIVTSDRAEENFRTGKDNDTSLFSTPDNKVEKK